MAGRFLVCISLKGNQMGDTLLEQILAEQRKTNALLAMLLDALSEDYSDDEETPKFTSLSQRAD